MLRVFLGGEEPAHALAFFYGPEKLQKDEGGMSPLSLLRKRAFTQVAS